MRFSESWLREWVDPAISTQELADQLSMAGLEVDAVEPAAALFDGVVVGEVVSREQHPDADKLSVCQVQIGAEEPLQIVCGAKNVAAGLRVPVATVGANLPGDFKIKQAKLRGVASSGMICSASELGMAESSDGILPLAAKAPVGTNFRSYLNLDDACIEVDLTPDRGDCLSVAGIAREVGVINKVALQAPDIPTVEPNIDDKFEVEVKASSACPRYLCRVIRGVNTKAETPVWMTEKLRRSNIRSISPVVDITNYVLLELGQPMHGFDLAKLDTKIIVRFAQPAEKLTLLDGTEIELKPETLVIADAKGPLALAGIMGGDASGVTDSTQDVVLESAFFAPSALVGKARSYGLHTDSSHRFERGVDPNLQKVALERASALLLEIAGGQAGPIVEIAAAADLPKSPTIELRRERIDCVLGIEIADDAVEDILSRLGMAVKNTGTGWQVIPPSARFDLQIEVDLIEELGRIYGYDRIEPVSGVGHLGMRSAREADFNLNRAKQRLVDSGYQEVITYSFLPSDLAKKFSTSDAEIALANPISAELAVMRPSLWPGLIQTLKYNKARQQDRVRIFESGLTFNRVAGDLVQKPKLAGLIFGNVAPEQWGLAEQKVDFFDLKADVEAVLADIGLLLQCRFEAAENPFLHPGQSAKILHSEISCGWLGQLHPELAAALDIKESLFLFELDLNSLDFGQIPTFEPLSKFPSNRRDLALVVDEKVSYNQLMDCVRAVAPEIVRDIRLFDVYTGEKVDSGRKSLALSLILQDSLQTLVDEDIDKAVTLVVRALSDQLGAELRD